MAHNSLDSLISFHISLFNVDTSSTMIRNGWFGWFWCVMRMPHPPPDTQHKIHIMSVIPTIAVTCHKSSQHLWFSLVHRVVQPVFESFQRNYSYVAVGVGAHFSSIVVTTVQCGDIAKLWYLCVAVAVAVGMSRSSSTICTTLICSFDLYKCETCDVVSDHYSQQSNGSNVSATFYYKCHLVFVTRRTDMKNHWSVAVSAYLTE